MDRLRLPVCERNTSFDAGADRGCRAAEVLCTQACMPETWVSLPATWVNAMPLVQKSVALGIHQSLRKLSWQPLQVPPVAAKAVLMLSKVPVLAAALSLVASA